MKRFVFTGHRDCVANEEDLRAIAARHPDAVWVHGGAIGFDSQVAAVAKACGIECVEVRPDYDTYPPKVAPLRRNDAMLEGAERVIACHDGRQNGGTVYTMREALRRGLPVWTIKAYPIVQRQEVR